MDEFGLLIFQLMVHDLIDHKLLIVFGFVDVTPLRACAEALPRCMVFALVLVSLL